MQFRTSTLSQNCTDILLTLGEKSRRADPTDNLNEIDCQMRLSLLQYFHFSAPLGNKVWENVGFDGRINYEQQRYVRRTTLQLVQLENLLFTVVNVTLCAVFWVVTAGCNCTNPNAWPLFFLPLLRKVNRTAKGKWKFQCDYNRERLIHLE